MGQVTPDEAVSILRDQGPSTTVVVNEAIGVVLAERERLTRERDQAYECSERDHRRLLEATKAGTPYWTERDTMNALVVENHRLCAEVERLERLKTPAIPDSAKPSYAILQQQLGWAEAEIGRLKAARPRPDREALARLAGEAFERAKDEVPGLSLTPPWLEAWARTVDAVAAALGAAPLPTGMGRGIYVASRASVPERAEMWRRLRSEGWPIISTWIDEDGPGQTEDLGELWSRIAREVAGAAALVLYAEPGDFPLKGALVEVGMALASDVPVVVVAPAVEIEPRSCRPIGSWMRHPLVSRAKTVVDAFRRWSGPLPAATGEPKP